MKYSTKKTILKLQSMIVFGLMLLSTAPFFASIAANETQPLTNDLFTIIYNKDNDIEVTFNSPELIQNTFSNDYGEFTTISLKNAGYLAEIGKPMLPLITRHLAITDTTVTLEVVNTEIQSIQHIGMIYPAQSPQSDDGNTEPQDFFINQAFYTQNLEYPEAIATITNSGSLRNIPFITLSIAPAQYNPATQYITIYKSITLRITAATNPDIHVEHNYKQSEFYNLYTNTFLNWDLFLDQATIIPQDKPNLHPLDREDGCDYIIITHPNFYDPIKDLAAWRHQTGMMTKLINVTDIGSSSTEIKNYIKNAYDTWNPQPTFVLLVGDAEYIPLSDNYYDTDLYYATVDGTDYFPDIFVGRIPVDTVAETDIIVDKILLYDQAPPSSSDFYENLALAAYFQDDENNGYETRRFVRTSEEIRDNLTSWGYTGERIYVTESYINPTHYNNGYYGNGEPLPPELLRPTFAWDGDAADIINAVDNGVFILNHRDHGAEWGWGDPHFDTGDIMLLDNGDLTPVVFSINCLTGAFQNGECFCEVFLRRDNGGAVAIYGATDVSYSGYNDFLALGFYDAIWPDLNPDLGEDYSLNRFGQILNNGKIYMTQTWGDPWNLEQTTFELHHIFGDPAQSIRTQQPQTFEVDHPPNIPYGPSVVEITVTENSNPVEGALISLIQPNGFYARNYTDETGLAQLEVDVQSPDPVSLTITGYNFLPETLEIQIGNSKPPLAPTMNGPAVGRPNKEYKFTATTTDPEEDDVLYLFDWGDGTQSDWIGPVPSGDSINAYHAYPSVGNYSIKVRAKDVEDAMSYWSDPHIIQMALPILDLSTIQGGLLKIKVYLRNHGIAEADDINWKIELDGGFIIIGRESSGIIPTIEAGSEATITSDAILGFGKTRVIITCNTPESEDTRSQSANILLFYINVIPGGG